VRSDNLVPGCNEWIGAAVSQAAGDMDERHADSVSGVVDLAGTLTPMAKQKQWMGRGH